MGKRFLTWTKLFAIAALLTFASACATMDDSVSGEAGFAVGSISELQDDQILHTFLTINEGEIATSRSMASPSSVAMSDSTSIDHSMILTGDPSADVRAFAQMMIAHHSMVVEEIQNTADSMDLELQPNQVSMTLNNTAQGVVERMESLTGMQEEMEYILTQIVLHQNALNMLDHTLIPQADDTQLRQMLQDGRQDVANHLIMAQQIRESMQAQMGQLEQVNR
jgi:putative membrane protein